MQVQAGIAFVWVLVNMIEPFGVKAAGPPDNSMDFVTFGEQQFCEVRAILPGDAGNECPAIRFDS